MADKAHRLTDEKLEEMEKQLFAIYSRAGKEWIEPTENSSYMKDEIYTDDIEVYRCLEDNTLNDATISPTSWTIE